MYTGHRILIVEDEPLIALLIADWLQELQYEVTAIVSCAADALKVADRVPLDVALLDVNLGGEESYSLADALRTKGVTVAFITGRDSRRLPERFDGVEVLPKPFEITAIQAFLNRLVGSSGR